MARTTKNPGIFAGDATTTIPPTPVTGVSYRDDVNGLDNIRNGWPFKTIVDSAEFAQIMHELTSLTDEIDKTGILEWSDEVDYDKIPAYVIGSDGQLYKSTGVNGPATTVVDPVGDLTGTWINLQIEDTPSVRNEFINGAFQRWARQITFTSNGSQKYTADMWFMTGSAGVTLQRQNFTVGQTDVPGDPENYLQWTVNSTGTGTTLRQRLPNGRRYNGVDFASRIWARVTSGTHTATVQLQQESGNIVALDDMVLTTTWQPFDNVGVTPTTSVSSDYLEFRITAEDAIHTIEIAVASFTKTNRVVPVELEDDEENIRRCIPWYRKSYSEDIYPGAIATEGAFRSEVTTTSAISHDRYIPFGTPMASDPTVTIYSPETGAAGFYRFSSGAGADVAALVGADTNENGITTATSGTYSGVVPQAITFHYEAKVEL